MITMNAELQALATECEAGLNEAETMNFRKFVENEVLLSNVMLSRSNFLEQQNAGVRDIDRECGYPTDLDVKQHYKEMYDRMPIATRVVEVEPEECWNMTPIVFEDEDPDKETPFELAFKELGQKLRGSSKFKTEGEGSPIWEYMKRVDILSGIGHYGLLFLGVNDGQEDLRQPVEPREGLELSYLRAFDESVVDISTYNDDVNSERFTLPEVYSVEFATPDDQGSKGSGVQSQTKEVHWTRVIHIADNMGSNEVFGVPRQRPVFNRLWDLRKLYGGSAEMYWKGAFPGLSIETHPQLGGSAKIDVDSLRSAVQKYMNGLQRYLSLRGMQAKSLAPQVVDPTQQINVQLEAISIQKGIPMRILKGSERGELASSQDSDAWDDRCQTRRTMYITPRMIVPFIDRLVEYRVLPEPTEYGVLWEEKEALTEEQQANVARARTEAIVKFVQGDGEVLMSKMDFLVKVLGFTSDEAEQIIDSAEEAYEEVVEARLERQVEQVTRMQEVTDTGEDDEDGKKESPAKKPADKNPSKRKEDD